MACLDSVDGGVGHAVVSDDAVAVDYLCSVDGLCCGDVGSAVAVVAADSSSFEVACLVRLGCSCSGGCRAGSCSCLMGYLGVFEDNFDCAVAVVVAAVAGSCSLGDCESELWNNNRIEFI